METNRRTVYLLNLTTRTIHDAASTDGRCRIAKIQEGNKMLFDSFEAAKNYLPDGKKVAKSCSICLGADYDPTRN